MNAGVSDCGSALFPFLCPLRPPRVFKGGTATPETLSRFISSLNHLQTATCMKVRSQLKTHLPIAQPNPFSTVATLFRFQTTQKTETTQIPTGSVKIHQGKHPSWFQYSVNFENLPVDSAPSHATPRSYALNQTDCLETACFQRLPHNERNILLPVLGTGEASSPVTSWEYCTST